MTPELLDWLNHSVHLCEDRLNKLNEAQEPFLRPVLTDELKARRFCLNNMRQAKDFQGAARVWWEYMTYKAELSAAWYHGSINDDQFYRESAAIRTIRDLELKQVGRIAWLPVRATEMMR